MFLFFFVSSGKGDKDPKISVVSNINNGISIVVDLLFKIVY